MHPTPNRPPLGERPAPALLAVILTSTVLVVLAWAVLERAGGVGPATLAMALVPLAAAVALQFSPVRLLPDVIFGAIDTGLLTIPALVGAWQFGVIGAILGGVIGDAITDGIAGFFEGSIAAWLRARGIEESRTAAGSGLGKMTGCLIGCGAVLAVAELFGLVPRLVVPGGS
jgi:hypothetical protein